MNFLYIRVLYRAVVNCGKVWQDGIANASRQPVNQTEWNRGVKMFVNAFIGGKKYSVFELANAGYQVKAVLTNTCA